MGNLLILYSDKKISPKKNATQPLQEILFQMFHQSTFEGRLVKHLNFFFQKFKKEQNNAKKIIKKSLLEQF